jgi:hypothetical protein
MCVCMCVCVCVCVCSTNTFFTRHAVGWGIMEGFAPYVFCPAFNFSLCSKKIEMDFDHKW